jgi:four helix bundle protein
MYEYYFERMSVWKNARNLVNEVYSITKKFPKDEEYHLKSQMRRSASSVKSNIAEGQGRKTKKDQAHYTTMSFSSLIELVNHTITARDQLYINQACYINLRNDMDVIAGQLSTLKKVQEDQIN